MITNSWSVKSKQIKTTRTIGMLQIRWEHKLEDIVNGYFGPDIRECRWFLRNRQQKNVSFFVCCFCIVRAPKSVTDLVLAINTSESCLARSRLELSSFRIVHLHASYRLLFFCGLWILVTQQLFPPDDGGLELDFHFFGRVIDFVNFVNQ